MYSAYDWFVDGFVAGVLFAAFLSAPYAFGWGPAAGYFSR